VGEVGFNGSDADNQSLGDLAVGEPVGGHRGDAPLGWSQGVGSAVEHFARAGAGGQEFLVGERGKRGRVAASRDREALLKGLSGSGWPSGTT
jgi:hypothetical protein